MNEKRRFTRVPFQLTAMLVSGGERHGTEVLDVSLKGALVSRPPDWTEPEAGKGTLGFLLDGSDVWIYMEYHLAFSDAERLGLEFVSIDLDSMVHLRRILELNLGDAALVERELANLDS